MALLLEVRVSSRESSISRTLVSEGQLTILAAAHHRDRQNSRILFSPFLATSGHLQLGQTSTTESRSTSIYRDNGPGLPGWRRDFTPESNI